MNNDAAAAIIAILCCECTLGIIGIVVAILYLLALQKALAVCAARNRTMEPGMVWLNLIPFFSIYWIFHTVINIAMSLKNEFADRELDDGGDYGKTVGTWCYALQFIGLILYCIGITISVLMGGQGQGPNPVAVVVVLLMLPLGLASFVMWIIYWVKIAGYTRKLSEDRGRSRGRFEDDDDDLPPRRPSRPDDRIR